jgi:hypothetical protein
MLEDDPETAAYIAALPKGLESYPECEVKGSVVREIVEHFDRSLLRSLPPSLRALVEAPPPVSAWVHEVPVNALILLSSERLTRQTGDRNAMNQRAFETTKRLLSTPLYKILFWLVSPERLIVGADKRWGALRRGTRIDVHAHDARSAKIRAHFPPKHYNERLLSIRAESIRASILCAGAQRATVTVQLSSPSSADFDCAWS